MRSLLSPHAQLQNNPARDLEWIRQWNPPWPKMLDPNIDKLRQLLDIVQNVTLRVYTWSEEYDWLRRDPEGLGREHAERWRRKLFDEWGLTHDQVARLTVEGLNEPPDENREQADRLNRYEVARAEASIQHGIYTCGPNNSTGHIYNHGTDTPPDFSPYREFVELQKQIGGAASWGFHEYTRLGPDSHEWGWHMGRITQRPDWMRGLRVLITECAFSTAVNMPPGTPGIGWKGNLSAEDYAHNYLGRYDYKMAQDPDVEALNIFVFDTVDPGSWGSKDIANEEFMPHLFRHVEWQRQQPDPNNGTTDPDPQPDPPSNGNGGTMPDPTTDPRHENCRAFAVDSNNRVVGVELTHEPKPDTTFFLRQVQLIDENKSGGQTVATVRALDKDGLEIFAPVVLGWPWPPGMSEGAYPGNSHRPAQHVISNGYDASTRQGPLCIYIGDVGNPDSDVIGGLGLPHNRHVSFDMTFQIRGEDDTMPPPTGDTFEERLRQAAQANQRIQFNPDAALQKQIFADGYVPNSGEFEIEGHVAQRAERLDSNEVRVYYVRQGDWDNVQHFSYRG